MVSGLTPGGVGGLRGLTAVDSAVPKGAQDRGRLTRAPAAVASH